MQGLPRVIWMYWDQGWDQTPWLVKKCRQSWIFHNPDWEFHFLDQESLGEYFDLSGWQEKTLPEKPRIPLRWRDFLSTKIKIQHISDIIRINLLHAHGGIWADATLWCRRPLDEWCTDRADKGFFAFSNPSEDHRISNWFLCGSPSNHIIRAMKTATDQYWSERRRSDQYFWFHSLFNKLYESDPTFRQEWDKVPKIDDPISADFGPHYFAPYTENELGGFSDRFKQMVDGGESPVFKLTNRDELGEYEKIQYLFNSIKSDSSGKDFKGSE